MARSARRRSTLRLVVEEQPTVLDPQSVRDIFDFDDSGVAVAVHTPTGSYKLGDRVLPSIHAPSFIFSRDPDESAIGEVVGFDTDVSTMFDKLVIVRFRNQDYRLKVHEIQLV